MSPLPHNPKTAFDIESALARLPDEPGVYRMYNTSGKLIYIGKAKVLKNRVRSYFQKNAQHPPKVKRMVQQIHHFDYVVTNSELEALILEANLIKTHKPPFNILLRDDRRYPWLALSNDDFPRLYVTRLPKKETRQLMTETGKTVQRRTKYFGPCTSSYDMYDTLKVLRKHFPLRQRRKPLFKDRPCMNYSIGQCPGPCQGLISKENYAKNVHQVEMLLRGRADELLDMIATEMATASEALNYEWAAKLRDRYRAVENILHGQQKIEFEDESINRDAVSIFSDELRSSANVIRIRHGKIISSQAHQLQLSEGDTEEDAYNAFLLQFYNELPPEDIPDEVLVQYQPEEGDLLAQFLTAHRQQNASGKSSKSKKVIITLPKQGNKRGLIDMGIKNAREALEQTRLTEALQLRNDPARALMELQDALDLPDFPSRIECYYISHVQGSHTVASMVVFIDGRPDKSLYRRFKIKTAEGKPDDFKSMFEVIQRRFRHTKNDDEDSSSWDDPDLVIIDGGKGQLNAATEALEANGIINQPIISLAKKFEEVYLPGKPRPVILPRDSSGLFLLQQVRDEAHRFAITYHRKLRGKGAKESVLDNIPGLGPKRRDKLMQHYGSIKRMQAASLEELVAIGNLPEPIAQLLYQQLHTQD